MSGVIKQKPCFPHYGSKCDEKVTPRVTHVFTVHSRSDSVAGSCRVLLDMFLGGKKLS